MIGLKTPLDRARGKVAELEATVARWETEATTRGAELADLRGRAGDEVLADESAAGRIAAQVAELTSRQEIAGSAAAAAVRKLEAARREVLRAEAADLRERAGKLTAAADRRQKKVDAMLAELSAFEGGARYVAWQPSEMDWERAKQGATITWKAPTTTLIRRWAAKLEKQAATREKQAADERSENLPELLTRPLPERSELEREYAGAR